MMFDWPLLAQVLALVLIAEGLMPFCAPGRWRRLFEQMVKLTDDQIRVLGAVSLGIGLVLLWMV